MLIGMNIINLGDFSVSKYQGKTVFSFRVPSAGCTDYVAMANAHTPVKVGKKPGRNDPCPCGSGAKYKNCCGKNKQNNNFKRLFGVSFIMQKERMYDAYD